MAGVLVGLNMGTVQNCYNKATINGTASASSTVRLGGLVGENRAGTINSCYNQGAVNGSANCTHVGGIAGGNDEGPNSIITNCYNRGIVTGGDRVCGIAGYMWTNAGTGATISNCYNYANLPAGANNFHIAYLYNNTITNCHFLNTATGNGGTATAQTSANMQDPAFVTTLNNGGTAWDSDVNNYNNGYPVLSWQNSFTSVVLPAKSLTSITYNQASTANVYPGTVNNEILRLDFLVGGVCGTLNLNSIVVAANNSNNADVTNIKLFRTTTTTFSTTNQLGSTQTFSGGNATFSGLNYNLPIGTTYVWVTYDIAAGATVNNVVDAKIMVNQIDVNGSTYPAVVQDPAGSRPIAIPPPTCQHKIRLRDTYGDGWNGNAIDVSVDGTVVLNNITLINGPGGSEEFIDFTFDAPTGTNNINVVRSVSGGWPEENRIQLFDGGGVAITGEIEPQGGSGTNHNGSCPVCSSSNYTVLPASSSSTTSSGSCTDANGWTHYFNGSNLLLSLKLGSSGAVVTDVSIDADGGANAAWFANDGDGFPSVSAPGTGAAYMKRKWNVNAGTQPSSPVDVRFYFTQTEYDAVNSVLQSNSQTPLSGTTQLNFYKVLNGMDPFNIAPGGLANTNIELITNGASAGINTWVQGSQGSDYYAEFKVAGFSGGGAGGADAGKTLTSGTLPLDLLSFKGYADKSVNVLEWTTANEINTDVFIIERSENGLNWADIVEVDAPGNTRSTKSYKATDDQPFNKAYYRLKSIDRDGRFQVSDVIFIERNDRSFRLYSVSPNPSNGNFTVSFNTPANGESKLILVNSLGMKVHSQVVNAKAGTNAEYLNAAGLANGIYTMLIEQDGQVITRRVVINN